MVDRLSTGSEDSAKGRVYGSAVEWRWDVHAAPMKGLERNGVRVVFEKQLTGLEKGEEGGPIFLRTSQATARHCLLARTESSAIVCVSTWSPAVTDAPFGMRLCHDSEEVRSSAGASTKQGNEGIVKLTTSIIDTMRLSMSRGDIENERGGRKAA